MPADNIRGLIERIEASSEGSRELDVAIGLAVGGFFIAEPRWPGAEPMIGYVDSDGSRVEPGNGAQDSLVPRYTASIDAAATLVPDGWYWRAGHGVLWPGWAHLNRKHPDHCDRDDEHSAHGETPALALCAASLKAMETPNG